MKNNPVILTIDIETTPIVAYTWDLYPRYLSIDNIVSEWSIICAAWKEVGKDKVHSERAHKIGDDYQVVKQLGEAITKADIIVGQNIEEFDIKKINSRLAFHSLPPMPKLRIVDTKKEAKELGRFTSNKLDYLGKHLLGKGKMHVDYQLWLDVMAGSKKALSKMVEYNKEDVLVNEELYLKLRPYMKLHPHVAVYQDGIKADCPKCGSSHTQKRGITVTNAGTKYQRLQCQDCGGWHSVPLKQAITK